MDNYPNASSYCQALKLIAEQLGNVGAPVNEDCLVLCLVTGLSSAYDSLATIIQRLDPLPSFYKVRSMLTLEETRRHKNTSAKSALLHTQSDVSSATPNRSSDATPSRYNNRNTGGRGRQSRGKGNNNSHGNSYKNSSANNKNNSGTNKDKEVSLLPGHGFLLRLLLGHNSHLGTHGLGSFCYWSWYWCFGTKTTRFSCPKSDSWCTARDTCTH